MESQELEHARLCLGITKKELRRRIELGQIDTHLIKSQLNHYSHELKREALTEKWLNLNAMDQVDKFHSAE